MALAALETETLKSRDCFSVNLGIENRVQLMFSKLSMLYCSCYISSMEVSAETSLKVFHVCIAIDKDKRNRGWN